MTVLQVADLPNILAVMSFVLSTPSSAGYVQRVVRSMKNKFTDVQNKCSVALMKSELIVISLSFTMQLWRINDDLLLQEIKKSASGNYNYCCTLHPYPSTLNIIYVVKIYIY